jgi:hypothetical protein
MELNGGARQPKKSTGRKVFNEIDVMVTSESPLYRPTDAATVYTYVLQRKPRTACPGLQGCPRTACNAGH